MLHRVVISFLLIVSVLTGQAQTGSLSGIVLDGTTAVPFANVILDGPNIGTATNEEGAFELKDVAVGNYTLLVSSVGYRKYSQEITVSGSPGVVDIRLEQDVFDLDQVVVTGTRSIIKKYETPVIINTVSIKTFEATQSLSISEGLNFSPGLRIENNCQNCGFTQLRMNGLDGAYSQVLINSRPVFSALAGVYGLEMIPANMVDRIEVVRGGGSVMYGGNAIAGTVNVITKDPMGNSFEVGFNQSFINLEASDRTVNFNGSVVSKNVDKGITLCGFNRTRKPWDANGDGFSEMVKLRNNTFGLDAFWNVNSRNKLRLGAYYINEFRRGGNKFDLSPHQTDVTEQLRHDIISTNLSYEVYSKDLRHKVSTYGSLQMVDRDSYYGGGGRVLAPGDSLTEADILAINAYGNSKDVSAVGGLQYNYDISKKVGVIAGAEYNYNEVVDNLPGYSRLIDEEVGTIGSYLQVQYKPIDQVTLLAGGRFDHVDIKGQYDLDTEQFETKTNLNIIVPRVSVMFGIVDGLKIRASYAQGYRGPQAFDEDLHIETIGGAARFIRINPNLVPERSNSALLSFNFDRMVKRWQMNFVVEGFYTQLANPFILSDQQELPSGVAVVNKRNGSGAMVAGANIEANVAFGSKLIFQSGATIQTARFSETEELWAPEDENDATPVTSTDRLLRTPDAYGFFSLVYTPIRQLSISYSGIITGPMDVPHVIDVETERMVIKRSQTFFDNNIKVAYTFRFADNYKIEVFAGLQNIFDSYQQDFDLGADRDAGYVYGPLKPRTVFAGLKIGLN